MAGNSQRRGAVRKAGTKKGQVQGSGGVRRRGLEGRGATPAAKDRPYHPAHKKARAAAKAATTPQRRPKVAGRAAVPATALYVAIGAQNDERLTESVQIAADKGIAILEVQRGELDRMSENGLHQGIALQVPPYVYAHPDDLLARAQDRGEAPLIVALDNITDPRNLGAVIRSAAAFGGHGVVIPGRRSAAVTAVTWRTSAGAAARLPVAQAPNLNRTLADYAAAGLQVVGLDAGGDVDLDDYRADTGVVVVVGSEGKGLSRLVRENCDVLASIPIGSAVESLNASVAAAIALYEITRSRG